jgi:hypothetical protein
MLRAPRRRVIYIAWFFLHFAFIAIISSREVVWLISHQLTVLPSSAVQIAKKLEPIASVATTESLPSTNLVRRGLLTYFEFAGIDHGYGYFAPNIPGSYRLVFELHYPDAHIEYALPAVSSKAAGLRLVSLLDEIGHAESDAYREYLIRQLVRATWREHPDAMSIRAILGISILPSIAEFEKGKRESYEFLYAYDFSRPETPASSANPARK